VKVCADVREDLLKMQEEIILDERNTLLVGGAPNFLLLLHNGVSYCVAFSLFVTCSLSTFYNFTARLKCTRDQRFGV